MQNTILKITASSNYWADKYQREATQAQTETIKEVGIGIVVALVVLIIVIVLIFLIKKGTDKAREQENDTELKAQLRELLEQNRKLSDKVEQLEKDSKKKSK